MTTLAEVRDALRIRLATIEGLSVSDYVPGTINPPALVVGAPTIDDYTDDLDLGSFVCEVELLLFVTATIDVNQRALYPYMERTGPKSIFAKIREDRSLGFDDVAVDVIAGRQLNLQQVAAYNAYGAAVTVRVSLGG